MSYGDDLRELNAFLNAGDAREEAQRRKHRLPQGSYAAPGCQFFFTICARHHGSPFTDGTLAKAIVDSLLWRKARHGWKLYCYCLMPDHLHVVGESPLRIQGMLDAGGRGSIPVGILEQIADFKRYTSSQIWHKHGDTGSLWQKSSYDRVLRQYDSILDAVRYVLNNPVRKGLVQHWEDYPYSAVVDEL